MSTQQDATVNIHVNNQEAEEKVKELSALTRRSFIFSMLSNIYFLTI